MCFKAVRAGDGGVFFRSFIFCLGRVVGVEMAAIFFGIFLSLFVRPQL
jgi:hypothetical protein